MDQLDAIRSCLPLTSPLPPLFENTPTADLRLEHDLARAPDRVPRWQAYIAKINEDALQQHLAARGSLEVTPAKVQLLGDRLSSESGRRNYQRLVDVYERGLAHFPTSYKMWKAYLDMRKFYILGPAPPDRQLKLAAPKRKRAELDGLPGERLLVLLKEDAAGTTDAADRDFDSGWIGGLDGVVGAVEWRSLAAAYERALMWMPTMPRIWIDYCNLFCHPKCPAFLSNSHARRTFDRALRTLPGSLHTRVWRLYLSWAARQGPMVLSKTWNRFLNVDPSLIEYYVTLLAATAEAADDDDEAGQKCAMQASKLLLKLSRMSAKAKYRSPEAKSAFNLLTDWLDVVTSTKHADYIGLDLEDVPESSLEAIEDEEVSEVHANGGTGLFPFAPKKKGRDLEMQTTGENIAPQTSADGSRLRFAWPGEDLSQLGKVDEPEQKEAYDLGFVNSDTDPADHSKVDVERIIRRDGLAKYKDQCGRLWVGLATFWINKGEMDRARSIFEEGLKAVLTIRDFSLVFDAYAEFSEGYISTIMEAGEDDAEIDQRMQAFEELMDRRPFLVNEVLIRRNPNDVQEWEKRVVLWGTDDAKVDDTYRMAIDTVNPRKAIGSLHQLYISYAKFFEQGGAAVEEADKAEPDLKSTREVFEKAIAVPFKRVDDLAEVWIAWAEMEVRHGEFENALKVLDRATHVPRKQNISFHDETLTSQARLFKSLKLWSFRADMEDSLGSVESTKEVYDKIFELKIANAQMVINYANFLEENEYFEESFKVYERGLDLFTYPIRFEILNTYLVKFTKRYGGDRLERARDLFEDAVDKVPPKFAKSIFMMYGKLEEEHGLAKRAMKVYDRAIEKVDKEDQFEAFEVLIAKTASYFGLPATRPIYQRAIEVLPDAPTAEMCIRFAALERKLGEIDRARAIYAHGSQFCDPRVNPDYWQAWHTFELETGSEDTFREYLRIKRSVQARFGTERAYILAMAGQQHKIALAAASEQAEKALNPMEELEKAKKKRKGAFVPAQDRSAMAKPNSIAETPEESADAPTQENAAEIAIDVDADEAEEA